MGITGVHALLCTSEPDAVRGVLRDATSSRRCATTSLDIRGEPQDEGWGVTTTIVLPGGLDVMLYEPRHTTAI